MKPITNREDTNNKWRQDTNQISNNVGDPVALYDTDGVNYGDPDDAGLITQDAIDTTLFDLVAAINDVNSRKVKRTGDSIVDLRVSDDLYVDGKVVLGKANADVVHIRTQNITTDQSTVNLFNATSTTLNIGGNAPTINFGTATTTVNINSTVVATGTTVGALVVDGGINTPSNLRVGTNATVPTIYSQDATGGTLTLRANSTDLTGTVAVTSTTANALGSANGALTVAGGGYVAGNLTVGGDARLAGGTLSIAGNPVITSVTAGNTVNIFATSTGTCSIYGSATAINVGAAATAQTFNLGSGATQTSTYNVANGVTATGQTKTVNIGTGGASGSTTNIVVGSSSETANGSTTMHSQTVLGSATTANLWNTVATTVNAFGAATDINIGAATGDFNVKNATVTLDGSATIKGGSLTFDSAGATIAFVAGSGDTTLNLFDTVVTTVNAFGAATDINVGAATGDFNVKNATVTLDGALTVNGNTTIKGGTITFDSSGATIAFVAGSGDTTLNLFNTVVTTANILGAATDINIGAATGDFNVKNATVTLDGSASVNGGTLSIGTSSPTIVATTASSTATIFNTNATTITAFGGATRIDIGGATGAASTYTFTRNTTATFNYRFATEATASGQTKTVDIGTGAAASSATNVNIGSSNGGNTTINSATVVGPATTVSLWNTATTGINFGGAATAIALGGAGTTTTAAGNLTITGITTANGNVILGSDSADSISVNGKIITDILFNSSGNRSISQDIVTGGAGTNLSIIGGATSYSAGTVAAGALNITGGANTGSNAAFSFTGGAVNITGGTSNGAAGTQLGGSVTVNGGLGSDTNGVVNIGTSTTSAISIGATTITTTLQGPVVANETSTFAGNAEFNGILTTASTIVSDQGTVNIFDTVSTAANVLGAATSLTIGYDGAVASSNTNINIGNVATGTSKVINIGTGTLAGTGTTNIVLGPVGGVIEMSGNAMTVSTTNTAVTGTNTSIGPSIAKATYASVEFTVQAKQGSAYKITKVLAVCTGTSVDYTEFGASSVGTFTNEPTYDVDVSGANIQLRATSATSTDYKVLATAIKV